ncbi:dynamin family protein [Helicobacter cappadocius]|uniref:Dynamin N-terminal domain-containing protein n=1 Tax=Helicobacter cappadocius TaxID=3063998 RepID=A0AA90Q2M4_9HELI|nr:MULTISPECIES: dynamin family protein [unclassified Helicobacter]MDO7253033.1 hypothetical protein [Helicobacter sp. faydin-H75]MDP2538978.1 hypothetical protein [Helicobacter sp. faydin-H76]
MSCISSFIKEYQNIQNNLSPKFESGIKGLIKEVGYKLTQDKFSPSIELKNLTKKLDQNCKEPLKVSIFGSKHSGKSTFINTILQSHIIPSDPTHAKKTYIIGYGHTRSIIAYHKDHTNTGLNTLSLSALTKEELDKIAYFEINFPIPILKDLVIYKYPDIDLSDEKSIKLTTEKISQSDILIWINRIDDLANMEELNTFKSHIQKKMDTSLCILSHIDVLEKPEDIIPSLSFIKDHFGEIFRDILPISPIILYKELAIDEQLFVQKELQRLFQEYSNIKSETFKIHQKLLTQAFADTQESIKIFYKNRAPIPKDLQEQKTNLNAIFERLNSYIIPTARRKKEEIIKNELIITIGKIKKNYSDIANIYAKFKILLRLSIENLSKEMEIIKNKITEELNFFFTSLDFDRNNIIESILKNTYPYKTKVFLQNPNFFQILKGKKKTFKSYEIDSETIYQELLNQKSRPYRTYKALYYKFTKFTLNVSSMFENSLNEFIAELKKWQTKNELIKKKDDILSDFSYNNLRIFASNIYENIVLDFVEIISETDKELQVLFCKISTQLQARRELLIKHTISLLLQHFHKELNEASLNTAKTSTALTKEYLNIIIDKNFSMEEYLQTLNKDGALIEIFEMLNKEIIQLGNQKYNLIEKKIYDLELLEKMIAKIHQDMSVPPEKSNA